MIKASASPKKDGLKLLLCEEELNSLVGMDERKSLQDLERKKSKV